MRIVIAFLIFLFAFNVARPQPVSGFVYEKDQYGKRSPLAGVNVYWAGTTSGTFTDELGKLTFQAGARNSKLVVSLLGFRRDTLTVSQINRRLILKCSLVTVSYPKSRLKEDRIIPMFLK